MTQTVSPTLALANITHIALVHNIARQADPATALAAAYIEGMALALQYPEYAQRIVLDVLQDKPFESTFAHIAEWVTAWPLEVAR